GGAEGRRTVQVWVKTRPRSKAPFMYARQSWARNGQPSPTCHPAALVNATAHDTRHTHDTPHTSYLNGNEEKRARNVPQNAFLHSPRNAARGAGATSAGNARKH